MKLILLRESYDALHSDPRVVQLELIEGIRKLQGKFESLDLGSIRTPFPKFELYDFFSFGFFHEFQCGWRTGRESRLNSLLTLTHAHANRVSELVLKT